MRLGDRLQRLSTRDHVLSIASPCEPRNRAAVTDVPETGRSLASPGFVRASLREPERRVPAHSASGHRANC